MIAQLEVETWERKSFRIQAIEVKSDNMREVAEWCNGEFKAPEAPGRRAFIAVPGPRGATIIRAYVGDYITRLTTVHSYRVYKAASFKEAFIKIKSDAEKFAAVHQLVRAAMREQDAATYHGESSNTGNTAEVITNKILELF